MSELSDSRFLVKKRTRILANIAFLLRLSIELNHESFFFYKKTC